ncbi:hypothetical protein [Horticoccus sp. 23ND18S-11]|uniref:hypothetical protein n=1 Tax=Horticoccus sp. 23ND18S-11 TaxID=3391832 RepID=UPI0039C8E5CB
MSTRICEWLQLDRDRVLAQATAYQGLAYAREPLAAGTGEGGAFEAEPGDEGQAWEHVRSLEPGKSPVGAHYLKVAAAYLSAAAPREAGRAFAAAARWAQRQAELASDDQRDAGARRLSWLRQAVLMDACRATPGIEDPMAILGVEIEQLAPSAVGKLLAVSLRHLTLRRASAAEVERAIATLLAAGRTKEHALTGVLQLPLGFALRLGRMMMEDRHGATRPALVSWTLEFAGRLAERVAIAQASQRHWRALYSRLLPIEPEALLVVAAWRDFARGTFSPEGMAELLQHQPPVLQAYVEAARLIFDADAGPDQGEPEEVPIGPGGGRVGA